MNFFRDSQNNKMKTTAITITYSALQNTRQSSLASSRRLTYFALSLSAAPCKCSNNSSASTPFCELLLLLLLLQLLLFFSPLPSRYYTSKIIQSAGVEDDITTIWISCGISGIR